MLYQVYYRLKDGEADEKYVRDSCTSVVCDEIHIADIISMIHSSEYYPDTEVTPFEIWIMPKTEIGDEIFCLSKKAVGKVEGVAFDSILVNLCGKYAKVPSWDFVNLNTELDHKMLLAIKCSGCDPAAVNAMKEYVGGGGLHVDYVSMADTDKEIMSWLANRIDHPVCAVPIDSLDTLQRMLREFSRSFYRQLGISIYYGYAYDEKSIVMNLNTHRIYKWDKKLERTIPVDFSKTDSSIVYLCTDSILGRVLLDTTYDDIEDDLKAKAQARKSQAFTPM